MRAFICCSVFLFACGEVVEPSSGASAGTGAGIGSAGMPSAAGGAGAAGTSATSGSGAAGASGGGAGAAPVDAGPAADGGERDAGVEPLPDSLCNGGSEMRLAFSSEGGFVHEAYYFTNPFGHAFFLIAGDCTFYAGQNYMRGIATGKLSDAEAAELSRDVHFDELAGWSWDPNKDAACPDSGSISIVRAKGYGGCSCGCDMTAPAGLGDALSNAYMWIERLLTAGKPLEGPVTALALPETANNIAPLVDWPLDRTMDSIAGLVHPRNEQLWMRTDFARFPAATDYEKLREARAATQRQDRNGQLSPSVPVREGSMTYDLFVRDDLPKAAADGWDALRSVLPLSSP